MAYRIDLPNGESVRTDELLVGKVIDYCKAAGVSWPVVQDMPIINAELMRHMYRDQCSLHGCPVPGGQTMKQLAACFVAVDPLPEPGDGDDEEADPDADPPPAKS